MKLNYCLITDNTSEFHRVFIPQNSVSKKIGGEKIIFSKLQYSPGR